MLRHLEDTSQTSDRQIRTERSSQSGMLPTESGTNRGGVTSLYRNRECLKKRNWVSLGSPEKRLPMDVIIETPSKQTGPNVSKATGRKRVCSRDAHIFPRFGCRSSFSGRTDVPGIWETAIEGRRRWHPMPNIYPVPTSHEGNTIRPLLVRTEHTVGLPDRWGITAGHGTMNYIIDHTVRRCSTCASFAGKSVHGCHSHRPVHHIYEVCIGCSLSGELVQLQCGLYHCPL